MAAMERTAVTINGKPVQVELSAAAARALDQRTTPLFVELELYFSCLVKKFVHFREDSRGYATATAHENLHIYFRPVTSTACTWDVAERLGRQPEKAIDSIALRRVAPHHVHLDYVKGAWVGSYDFKPD